MNVKILSIKPAKDPNSHEVLLSIGEDRQIFKFTTEVNEVGGRQLQTTHGESRFSDLFKFNQRVAMNVSKLVVQFYNQEAVELPADVGNFVSPEEAVSQLKPFQCYGKEDMASMGEEVRKKAIALIKKLPESLLDEAVKVLESLTESRKT